LKIRAPPGWSIPIRGDTKSINMTYEPVAQGRLCDVGAGITFDMPGVT
jgi:hypothetical protein